MRRAMGWLAGRWPLLAALGVRLPCRCRRVRSKLHEYAAMGTDVPVLYPYPATGHWTDGYQAVIRAFTSSAVPAGRGPGQTGKVGLCSQIYNQSHPGAGS